MWIHLLALRIIDGAGGQVVPPTPDTGSSGGGIDPGEVIRGEIAPGVPYNYRKPVEVTKKKFRTVERENLAERLAEQRAKAHAEAAILDALASSKLASLESQQLEAERLLAFELEQQRQLELLEEEEIIALVMML